MSDAADIDDLEASGFSDKLCQEARRIQKAYGVDSVQIVVTRVENPGDSEKERTRRINGGAGNWFARYGAVRDWLAREESAPMRSDPKQDDEDD